MEFLVILVSVIFFLITKVRGWEDQKVNEIAIEALREKIVDHLSILLRVYSDTNENVNLPTGVNLQEVSAHLFFENTDLNNIYSDLLFEGTESQYFLQVLELVGRRNKWEMKL